MSQASQLPRVLIVDDLYGRSHPSHPNRERASLCAQYLLTDVTGDETDFDASLRIKKPVAEVVFWRGQFPLRAASGDIVENDLPGTLEVVRRGWFGGENAHSPWAMVLLDLCFYTGLITEKSNRRVEGMPEGRPDDEDPVHYFGLTLLSEISSRFPDLPIVMLSSHSREEVSREFSSRGALAFLPRADEGSEELFRDTLGRYGLSPDPTGEIVGTSKALLLALREARQAAGSRRNVLIRGERGVGKELLARYIHRHSVPSSPYIVIDSGTLNPQLYASELFGHRRGSFTGADSARTGKISLASGGDLFLDEIGNMPPDVQAGLLRVLEQREVTPLGAQSGSRVDVRFISATNEDLERKLADGAFREDLFDRLREGGTLCLPALGERREDIPALANKIMAEAEGQTAGSLKHIIEPAALQALQRHAWPGNIRELRNCITLAVTRYADVEHLFTQHFGFATSSPAVTSRERGAAATETTPKAEGDSARWEDALSALAKLHPDELDPGRLSQIFNNVQGTFSHLRVTLLKAALQATRRRTPDSPDGELLLHPAVKLLFGRRDISASKAADLIKKLIGADPAARELFLQDEVLREAYQRALRLRPVKSPRESRDKTEGQ
ncbi:MAG: sigma 54-interacting transcriptional regulator [Bryobacteraceae bacterium]